MLLKYILLKFPYAKSMGVYNCRNVAGSTSLSQHACGRACDIGIPVLSNGAANTALGYPIIRFLYEFSTEFGIVEQIYDRVKYDDATPMGRYYGGVHPHNDHDHTTQSPAKALSLTFDYMVSVAGSPTPQGEDMLLQKGSKGQEVAELQKMLAERYGQSNGAFTPYPGKSAFDGQAFASGEDGDYGTTCETNVKNVQGLLAQAKTGVVNQLLWDAMVNDAYVKPPTVVDLTKYVLKTDFAKHTLDVKSTTPHS